MYGFSPSRKIKRTVIANAKGQKLLVSTIQTTPVINWFSSKPFETMVLNESSSDVDKAHAETESEAIENHDRLLAKWLNDDYGFAIVDE